jgi:quinol monooxygenase YgiN
LFVGLEAKPGKEKELGQFLQTGLNLARQEGTTPVWFALRLGPSTFGIFDAFTDEAGRQAHLNGSIAQALGANAPNLLAQPPSIERIDDVRIIQFPPRAQRVQSLTSLDRERCSVWPAPRRRRGISV